MPHIGRVLGVVGELASRFPNHDTLLDGRHRMLNERYLHHAFSHALQSEAPGMANLLDFRGPSPLIALHPEWPTYKKATNLLTGGCYSRPDKKTYMPDRDGKGGGFIDFALGDYPCPEIGVEFMLNDFWSTEETVFDFMKLLDSRNSSFQHSIYLGIILRGKGMPPDEERWRRKADQNLAEAVRRLGPFCRQQGTNYYFVITEVAPDRRRHLFYDTSTGHFLSSDRLPPFLGSEPTLGPRIGQPEPS